MKASSAETFVTYEPDGIPLAYDLVIRADVSPFVPASMYGGADRLGWAAEGPSVDDLRIEFVRATDDGCRTVDISDVERAAVLAAFEVEIERDGVLRARIEERLFEDAEERNQNRYEED